MASVINPIPTAASGALQILPFANNPPTANLEPSAGLVAAGYAPAPDAPDYRNANYILNKQSALNSRGIQAALFIENALGIVTVAGAMGVGNDRRITINGNNIDDTGMVGDTATLVAARFVAAINSNVLVNTFVFASNIAGVITIESLMPGLIFTLAVAVLAGAGTIVRTLNTTQPSIRTDVTGVGTAASGDPQMLDVVFGSISLEDGTAAGRERMQFRKAKAAFSVGEFTGTQADDANTGDDSMRLGYNAKASGARSFSAGGSGSESRAADALAMMGGIANGANDIAVGVSAVADKGAGSAAVAIGQSAQAGASSVAVGYHSSAAASGGGTAVGNNTAADGADALALATSAAATGTSSISAGKNSKAESANSIAIGESTDAKTGTTAIAIGKAIITLGQGALGTGITAGAATVNADGRGARAHGAPQTAPVAALAEGSDAMGDGCRAAGAFSHASGAGADAPNRGEFARSSLGPALTDNGKHQHGNLILQANTTDAATAVKFCTDKIDGTGAEWNPASSRGYVVRYRCVAKKFATALVAVWEGTFLAVDNGGTLTLPVNGINIAGGAFTIGAGNTPDMNSGLAAPTLKASVSGGVIRFEAVGGSPINIRYTLSLHYAQAGIA